MQIEIDNNKIEKLKSCVNLIKKSFECTICIDYFDDPVITNCQHAFCKKCIESYIGKKRNQSCPLCKTSINLRSLKEFTSLSYLVEKTKNLEEVFKNDLKKSQTPAECSSIGMKRKRTSPAKEEDNLSKKIKSNLDVSLITSTKQDTSIKIIEETVIKEKNEDKLKIDMLSSNKVEDWLDKSNFNNPSLNSNTRTPLLDSTNNPGAQSKITISKINNNSLDSYIPILNSIGDADSSVPETNQNLVIQETDVNQNQNQVNIQDSSKIDYPLKFTSPVNTTRHNKTNPRLCSTLKIHEPKIEDRQIEVPIFIEPNKDLSIKKTVRFGLRRSQSESNIAKPIARFDLVVSTNKKDSSTQTNQAEKQTREQSIQFDQNDFFDYFYESNRIETKLINLNYKNLENELIDQILSDYFDSVFSSSVQSIPDSPPTRHNLNETPRTNLKENFSELLNTSNLSLNKTSKQFKNKAKYKLEFLSEQSKQELRIEDTLPINQTMIIEGTPTKNQNDRLDLLEMDKTLSKSSNRLEMVKKLSIDTFNQSTIITDTVQLPDLEKKQTNSTLILNQTSLDKNLHLPDDKPQKYTLKKIRHEPEEQSFFLNSLMAKTDTPQLYMSLISNNSILINNQDIANFNKEPPKANDILGISLANESIQSSAEYEIKVKTKKNDAETQLLTDSACTAIENICKDFYSIQNQTLNEEQSTEILQSEKPKTNRLEFVFSLLTPEMKEICTNFANMNNINIAQDITDKSTHLIVDADKNLHCGVTCKYLKAISRKLWIVSFAWIFNCINNGQFYKPDKFEIKGDKTFGNHNGPNKSRLSPKYLYELHEFLFIGNFLEQDSVSLDEVIKLVSLNQGLVRRKAKDFSTDETKKKIVIFDDKAKKISKHIAQSLKSNQIECVNKSWLIDSLACFKLLDFKDYETYDD